MQSPSRWTVRFADTELGERQILLETEIPVSRSEIMLLRTLEQGDRSARCQPRSDPAVCDTGHAVQPGFQPGAHSMPFSPAPTQVFQLLL